MSTSKKAEPRPYSPFHPNRPIVIVSGWRIKTLKKDNITQDDVGLKAFGLVSIPQDWTKPFIVVSGKGLPTEKTIRKALESSSVDPKKPLMVRSSGSNESIESRGELTSDKCEIEGVVECIRRLNIKAETKSHSQGDVHWIIQNHIPPKAKGHLSNERRLRQHLRDWIVETEPTVGHIPEIHRIAIRLWRDSRIRKPGKLICPYKENYIDRLEDVARWAYQSQNRVHFEWVWDGETVYIVQADECLHVAGGEDPKSLVVGPAKRDVSPEGLLAFRLADEEDFESYPKLKNARMYRELGYEMPPFYVLDSADILSSIVQHHSIGADVRKDLNALTGSPLVIRTDILRGSSNNRQMLPRSDELRSSETAENRLLEILSKLPPDLDLEEIGFLGHHFLPATASAWSQGFPDSRRVRVESLWGIPEGLYYYAYDTFDVDTLSSSAPTSTKPPKRLKKREKLRYKGRFVAPNRAGDWVLYNTKAGPDWQRSIKRGQWIDEIAWTTRRIAVKAGHPVVVMWLVDVHRNCSRHNVLPWYHEEWKGTAIKPAPQRHISARTIYTIKDGKDWTKLKTGEIDPERISRLLVYPDSSKLVRDREFLESLASLASQNNITVELKGGILSHAYYMLSRSGCSVEAVDLDDYVSDTEEIQFNKLVRDKIPSDISEHGEDVEVVELAGEALILALKRKLVEEAFEVFDAKTTNQLIEELADLKEVITKLSRELSITSSKVENARQRKNKSRGGFEKHLMLAKTQLHSAFRPNTIDQLMNDKDSNEEYCRKISLSDDLPKGPEIRHVDQRESEHGARERQFTVSLPAYFADSIKPSMPFSMRCDKGTSHEMELVVSLERMHGEFRLRIRLINIANQLSLPLD